MRRIGDKLRCCSAVEVHKKNIQSETECPPDVLIAGRYGENGLNNCFIDTGEVPILIVVDEDIPVPGVKSNIHSESDFISLLKSHWVLVVVGVVILFAVFGNSFDTSDSPSNSGNISTDAPGGYNDQGCPRDQWVEGYVRDDGTRVDGYYRNSPHDGCGGG